MKSTRKTWTITTWKAIEISFLSLPLYPGIPLSYPPFRLRRVETLGEVLMTFVRDRGWGSPTSVPSAVGTTQPPFFPLNDDVIPGTHPRFLNTHKKYLVYTQYLFLLTEFGKLWPGSLTDLSITLDLSQEHLTLSSTNLMMSRNE